MREFMKFPYRRPLTCLCLLLVTATTAFTQKVKHLPPTPTPDVIAKVTAAKKIFVSNLGENGQFAHDIPGGVNIAYREFYATLKEWGCFQLVDSPAQADLIFEIQGFEELEDIDHTGRGIRNEDYTVTQYPPMLYLSILDPSQHLLYKIALPAGRAGNIPKGKIAFAKSIDALTDKVKDLVAAPAATKTP
jgi:hypothetical protein